MVRTTKTLQEQRAALAIAKKKLAEREAKLDAKSAKLSAESPGMKELLVSVQKVADDNKVKVSEIVKAISRLKKTGLKIEKRASKPKDPNKQKRPRGPNKPKQAPVATE